MAEQSESVPRGTGTGTAPPLQPTGRGRIGWEEVFRDNVDWVYALLLAKVGNPPDAEELTTEVFMTALDPLDVVTHLPGGVRTHLRSTARAVLARYWNTRVGREITAIEPDPVPLAADAGGSDPAGPIHDMLAGLPEKHRRILDFRFLQGLSIQEAALRLGIGVPDAEVAQHEALQMAARSGQGGIQ